MHMRFAHVSLAIDRILMAQTLPSYFSLSRYLIVWTALVPAGEGAL